MENSTVGLTLLPPGRTVPLDGEGPGVRDGDVPDRYRPRDRAERREVAVVLAWCEPEGGRDPGLLEVRLDGRVIGRLDHRTSQQYARHVDDVLDRGELPACAAVLRTTGDGVVTELHLPRISSSHAAEEDAPDPVTTRLPARLSGLPSPRSSPEREPQREPHRELPMFPQVAGGEAGDTTVANVPADPDAELTAIHPAAGQRSGTVVVPRPRRSPDGLAAPGVAQPALDDFPAVTVDWTDTDAPPPARRMAPWWIAGGVAAVLLLVAGLVSKAAVNEAPPPQAAVSTPAPSAPATAPTESVVPTAEPSATQTAKPATTTRRTTRGATAPTTRRAATTTAAPTTTAAVTPALYADCAAARAAGATPLREGDEGYNEDLDTDGDGIACNERESRRGR